MCSSFTAPSVDAQCSFYFPLLFWDGRTLLQLFEVAAGWCADVEREACYVLTYVVREENNKHVGRFCGYKCCFAILKTQPQNFYLAF